MNNQRINILRDELKQRCDEIVTFTFPKYDHWDLDKKIKDDFLQLVAEYVYFILNTPELQSHFIMLIRWHKDRIESRDVKEHLHQVVSIIKQLGSKLILYKTQLGSIDFAGRTWKNPFDQFGIVSPVELLSLLEQDHSYEDPIETIETLRSVLAGDEVPQNGILFYMKQFEPEIYKIVKSYFAELETLQNKLRAALIFELNFVGYKEAHEILQAFKFKYPDIPIQSMDERVSTLFKYDALREEDVTYIKNASQKIFKILSRALSANQLKTYTIFRLKSYMEWFYRPKRTEKTKWSENELTEEMAKFLFAQGFFPIIRFKMGKSEPDMLVFSEHEEILIEAKKYLKGERFSSKNISHHISQAIQYFHKLRSIKQGFDNHVYLVIFYNGDFFPICDESVTRNGVVVNVVFIYLGNKTPHEKRKDLILEINTQQKK
jgi:hypothetical protein